MSLFPRRRSSRQSHQYLTSAHGQKPKQATRHLAALDFLLGIRMANEKSIVEAGIARTKNGPYDIEGFSSNTNSDNVANLLQFDSDNMFSMNFGMTHDAPGRKLQGPAAPTVRLPMSFRYKLSNKKDQSAEIKKWEDSLIRGVESPLQPLLSSRLFFSRARGYPNAVMSVIKYAPEVEKAKLERQRAEDTKGLEVFEVCKRDWRGSSYSALLKSSADDFYEIGYMHDPNFLDDPTMIHGAAKQVLHGSIATGPIVSSIILFVNPLELRQSLNEQFREKHPQLPPSLTLSKIRKLKKSALLVCLKLDIEVSTVASACIYFERLCLKGLVTKANRKLTMAVCLLLAYKFNEPIASSHYKERLRLLLEYFDHEWEISQKEVFDAELGAYLHLQFRLHVPYLHVLLMFNRLLKLLHILPRGYLGDEMLQDLNYTILEFERKIKERQAAQLRSEDRKRDKMAEDEEEEVEDEEEFNSG